ncbi:ATP-dependent sacrificial sulfur transferase LarE [bacterium 210820-DFI.6.37]|nr:ATP-dependent sacrificial sulfur transferase LarE [bacterium 210820-DFI.6.37]
MNYEEKLNQLEKIIKARGRIAVAFSGGVDSAFLLLFGKKVMKDRILAITAEAPNFAPDEIQYARELCRREGIPHIIAELGPEILASFCHNPPDRCYICKKAIFNQLKALVAARYPDAVLADGTNLDDMKDYRPGRKALEELEIFSPLKEAGLTKAEVRRGLRELGADIWNKPAFACLASRIPYGESITTEKLKAIYKAEQALCELGFSQVRVRHHGAVARIEVLPEDREEFFDLGFMDRVDQLIKDAGFLYAALDLSGYRMGSLNEEIKK